MKFTFFIIKNILKGILGVLQGVTQSPKHRWRQSTYATQRKQAICKVEKQQSPSNTRKTIEAHVRPLALHILKHPQNTIPKKRTKTQPILPKTASIQTSKTNQTCQRLKRSKEFCNTFLQQRKDLVI